VVLALALLVIGGLALFRVFTSESDGGGGPKTSPQNGTTVRVTRSAIRTPKTTATHTLALKVTGPPTRVTVIMPGGTNSVLLDQVLGTGEVRYFDQGPLEVVVANGGAVDIYVHGKRQPDGEPGRRTQYHVNES
jgi:hypothetical protein